jgi:shikimate kinase
MYVKENKGDKDTYKSTLILTKIFKYLFVHQIENPQKPHAKVKKTREEMQATLEKRKKVVAKFSKSALKRKNRVKEG